jgi:hypothetical protein
VREAFSLLFFSSFFSFRIEGQLCCACRVVRPLGYGGSALDSGSGPEACLLCRQRCRLAPSAVNGLATPVVADAAFCFVELVPDSPLANLRNRLVARLCCLQAAVAPASS